MKQQQIKLSISGMTCVNCAKGIEKKLKDTGFTNVNINFSLNELSCILVKDQKLESLISVVKDLGYNIKKENIRNWDSVDNLFIASLIFTLPLFFHMFLTFCFS